MSFRIVALPEFEKELKKLGKKYRSIRDDYAHLLDLLDRNPSLGTPLGNNLCQNSQRNGLFGFYL